MINWEWNEADILEKNQQWNEARTYIYTKWMENQLDLKVTIRLGFLCWYILVEWDCINSEGVNQEKFENSLKEVTQFGLMNFSEEIEFLWIFGYMISMFPYYFGDYEEMEQLGIEMLRKAHHLDTSDSIVKMVYLGHNYNENPKEYEKSCKMSKLLIVDRFKGEGILAEYFREVLNR
ncbi:hypothetical protein FQB35_12855 [Crassaminicella thermophila]|uniref:Uncharacterized protein n=1 Tax=Crassaminicella thermophila TaxID=2599308 RepID=A0A5C0SHD3_CRATE|nr:hypothetical protein [Crassaminicella thermophila]QEK13136.1 hypothetical protein FQB35_12855 [Crassaminicella thermophila]